MKTQFTLWQKVANTPPIALLVLFVWLLAPSNAWGDPIAIGSGTVTLNYANTSNPTPGNVNTLTEATVFNGETCISFGNTEWNGTKVYSQVEWIATIDPGTYEIEIKYGSHSWGIHPLFAIYQGDSKVKDIYAPSSSTSGAWKAWADFSPETFTLDLRDLAGSTNYTIRVAETQSDAYALVVGHISFTCADCCASPVTASFNKGDATSGSVSDIENCAGNTFTMPGKGSMTYAGHKFTGWKLNNAGDLITASTSYTMPAGGASFTAQWTPFTVPAVTNASISAVGSVVTLAYSIPGICDLRNPIAANKSADAANLASASYNADDYVTASGTSPKWGQFGVAFAIPATTNVERLSFEYKGYHDDISMWGGMCDNSYAYWSGNAPSLNDAVNWQSSGEETPVYSYWHEDMGGAITTKTISQIAVYANAGNGTYYDVSFSVRNVRYHVAGQEDIDHVVIMRKAGQNNASTGLGDGTLLEPETRSKFVDDADKAAGWYTYTIFAVHADGTLSAGVSLNVEVEGVDTYTVTYDIDGASGTTPTAAREYAATESFSLPTQGDLTKAGHKFGGWSDGTNTYAAGASFTMPAGNVTLTAVWNPFTVPAVTNLAVGDAVDKEVPLSWSIPGICDLSAYVDPWGDGTNKLSNQADQQSTSLGFANDIVTAAGISRSCQQHGVAFPISETTSSIKGITAITIDCKGNDDMPSAITLWGGVINSSSTYTYWDYDGDLHSYKPTDWSRQTFMIDQLYWQGGSYSTLTNIDYIAVFANHACGGEDYNSFSVREVRYHVANREDIDHVIVVRKEGSAPANATDGTVYNVGTKSHFVDTDDTKEFGHTYYYSVYAVHADGTVSEAATTYHTVVETPTCNITFNIGEGAIGDAPTSVNKPANGTVTLPSIGTVYKPFYAFTGWKKNNAGDLLAAGSTYTVTAEDVTAETISFTAQWEEDNTTIRIPNTKTFGVSNKPANINTISDVDFNNDGTGDAALDIQNTAAEWSVFIQPGYYEVSMLSAVWRYGMKYTLSLIDPLTDTPVKTFFTKNISRSQNQTQYLNDTVGTFDLTDLIKGKRYVLKIEDTWTGCYLRVHDINFNPVTPEEIASEVVLDAGNTVTTGLTEVTDVDFPGDNDQSVNLYNKKMDWVVKIAKGYYNISLLYGAPEFSTRVSVALIDPEGVEPTRWFCPDQTDRNGHYYHTSGAAGTQYYSIGLDKRDLYDIDPEKTYIVRVHDENGSSNSLRVKDLTFTPIAPLNIPAVTRLNAANAVVSPGTENVTIDGEGTVECLDIAGLKEAAWYAYIAPGIYDIKLTYVAATGGTKVRFGIIDIASGDTVFVKQENKYGASNTTYTISALSHDFTTIGGGVYKIIVKDNYTSKGVPSNGSVPKVAHLDIERTLLTHTRSGLRIGDYGTICLPYAVAAADRTGAELFEIESWAENGTSMTMTQLNADEPMTAGRPYIFQATANTATFSYYVDGDETPAGTHNGLIGSYVEAQIQENDNNYIIYNNKLYLVNAPARVGAYRAYIHRGGEYSPAPANRRRVTMGLYGTQTTTDINQISTEQITNKVIRNGHLFILRGDKIYNAQGQLVQ